MALDASAGEARDATGAGGHGDEAEAVRRLRLVVEDRGARPGLADAVGRLLVAHEVGAQLPRSVRAELQAYAEACGATGGEPDVGAAIESLLGAVNRRGVFLGQVSFAHEPTGAEASGGVCVDLDVVLHSCDEAIAGRPGDGSIARVIIGADALRAIASFGEEVASEAARLLSEDPSGVSLARWVRLARLAARRPVVGGSAASDVWGEVVYPCCGHPLNRTGAHPGVGETRVAGDLVRAMRVLGLDAEASARLRDEVISALRCVADNKRGQGEVEKASGERLRQVAERLADPGQRW